MSKTKMLVVVVAASAVSSFGADRVEAANGNYRFCYSPAFAAWRNFPEPCIDGVIDTTGMGSCSGVEQGWANSFRYVFNNGTGTPDVTLLALANGSASDGSLHLDMGFQVRNDKTFDNEDLIVAAFQFSANQFGMVALNPISSGAVNNGHPGAITPPQQSAVQYFTSPDGAAWTQRGNANGWITYAATSSGNTACMNNQLGNCSWDVEMRINLNPSSGNDGSSAMPVPIATYVGVSRVYHVNGGNCPDAGSSLCDPPTDEFAWPSADVSGNADNMLLYDIMQPPSAASWGKSSVNTTTGCGGVFFGPNDMSVSSTQATDPHGNPCSPTQPQVGCLATLQVNAHNSSIDGSTGGQVAANGVQAQFLHAPFGSNSFGTFQSIGSSSAVNIPAGSTGTPLTAQWNPTDPSGHECILAKLTSNVSGTTFINTGEFINSVILPMSSASISPTISVVGLAAPAGGGPQRIRLSTQAAFQFAYAGGVVQELPLGVLTSQMSWQFTAARDTGRTVTIKNRRFRVLAPFSGHRLDFQHALAVDFTAAFEQRHQALVSQYLGQIRGTSSGGTSGGTTTGTTTQPGTTGPVTTTVTGVNPSVAIISDGTKRAAYTAINGQLATDPEKPSAAEFSTELKGVTGVPGAENTSMLNSVFDVEVPVDGQTTITSNATYVGTGTGGGTGLGGCCATTQGSTKMSLGSMGFVILGVFMFRRRRK